MTLFDFSQSIRKLNKQKKFSESLQFFKENKTAFTPEQIGLNKYIVYEIISALIETNHFNVIFTFIDQYDVILEPKCFSYLLKKFKNKPSVNWAVVNKFCDLVSVDSLDTECITIDVERKGKNKPMELASDKENWYAFKTKSLFETRQYQECFEISKQALEEFDKFHYSNEIWFARRIALSKKHLGNSSDALNELLLVLRKKKEWFIQSEIAEIYRDNGDFDKAFQYSIDAINNFGDLEYKVSLLVLIADILEKKQEKELSFKHYMLSKLLRMQEEWKVPQTLNFSLQNLGFSQIALDQISDLKRELRKYWDSFKPTESVNHNKQKEENSCGEVVRILHDNERGKVGFIRSNDKEYYFSVSASFHLTEKVVVGSKLIFKIIPATDEKKEQVKIIRVSE